MTAPQNTADTTSATKGFDCRVCGKHHDDLPRSFAFAMPDFVTKLPLEVEYKLTEDWCIVHDSYYYVRGCLEVPVIGETQPFVYGAWVALSEDDFYDMMDYWTAEGREVKPPYNGVISNTVPLYAETRGLTAKVQMRPVGQRPLLILDPADHRLCKEQREGMPLQHVIEMAEYVLHGGGDSCH